MPAAYVRLCALGADGHQHWAVELSEAADLSQEAGFAGGVLMGAAPALGTGGMVLIGSFTGCLYAIGDPDDGSANACYTDLEAL